MTIDVAITDTDTCDSDLSNNADSTTVTITSDEICSDETTCTDTSLDPTTVVLNNGDFEITCAGNNVKQFGVLITEPGAANAVLTMIPLGQNSLTYTPNQLGTYTFQCQAWGYNNEDPRCPSSDRRSDFYITKI